MVNETFWQHPPWHGGVTKHRLGLRPVECGDWLLQPPSERVLENKITQLHDRYEQVVGVLPHSHAALDLLQNLPLQAAPGDVYPDSIANIAVCTAADICLLDVADQQRLIAACVCAPSYWRLHDKLGKPLWQVHAPVDGMNEKIGSNVERFLNQMPVAQPFARTNWSVHGDAEMFHPQVELSPGPTVADWFVRSERQSLCKLSARYLLFTIDVRSEPLADLAHFAQARDDLLQTLDRMSALEITYSGGLEKHRRLTDYVRTLKDRC